MATDAFKYAGGFTPGGYACGQCAKHGCKLWRRYQTFLDHQSLFCVDCAGKNQSHDVSDIDNDGMTTHQHASGASRHDSIGWLVPAVPTEEGETYWGYTSVPDAGVAWWRALPSRLP